MSQHKAFFKAILAVFCVAAFLVTASNALAFTEQANSQTSIDKISVVGAGGKINIIDSEKYDPAKVSATIRNYPLNGCIDTRYVSPGDNLQVSFFLNTYTTPDGFNHWFVRYGCAKDPASIVETSVIGKSYSPTIAWKTPTFIKGQYCKIWIYAMKGTNANEDSNTKIGGANTRPISICPLTPSGYLIEAKALNENSINVRYRWMRTGDNSLPENGKAYLYVYDKTCTTQIGYAGPITPSAVENGGDVNITKGNLKPSIEYCAKVYVVSAEGSKGFVSSNIIKTLASAPKAGESLETNFVICRKADVNTCSPFTVQNPTTLSGCKAQIANLGIAKLADCYLANDSASVSECNSLCKNVDSGTGPYIEITQPTANNLTCLSRTATSKVEAYLPTKVSITTGATADIFFEIFDKTANKVVLSQSYANKSGNVQIDYKPQLEQYKEYQFRVLASDSLNHTSRQTVDFKTPDCLPAQELSYCEGLVCKGLKISQDKCRALNGGKDCAAGLNCSGLQCTGSTALSVETYIPETTDFNCLAKTLTSKVETSVLGKLVGTGTSANANVFLDIYEKVSGKAIASQYFMGKVAGDQVSFKSTLDQGLEYRFKVSAYNAQTSAEKTVYFTTPYCATPESNENLSYCAGTVCKGLNTTKSNCRTLNNGVDCVPGLYCGGTASNPDATCKAPVTANFTLSIPEVSVKDCSAAGAKADVSVIILPNLGTATGGNVVVEQLNSLGNVVASKTFSSVASYQNYYWSFVIGATETAKVRATLYVVGGKVSYTKDVVVKCGSEAIGDYSYCDNLACRSTVSTPSACKALNKGVDCYKGKYCEGTVSNPDTKCLGKDSNRIVIELPSQFDQICMGDTLIRAIVRTRVNATYNGAAGTVTMKILSANGTELLSKQYTNALAGSAFGEEFNFQPGQKYTVSAKLSAGGGVAQNIFSEFIPKNCAPTDTVKEYSYCSGIVCNTVKTTAAQCKVRNNGVDCFDVPYCGGNASDYGDSKCATPDTSKDRSYCSGTSCVTIRTTAAECKNRNGGKDCFDVPYCGGLWYEGDKKCAVIDPVQARSYCSGNTCKTVNTTAASCKILNNGVDCFTTAYCGGSASDYGDSKCGGFVAKFTNPLNNQSLFIGDAGEIAIENAGPGYQYFISKRSASTFGYLNMFCNFVADANGKGRCAWTVGNYEENNTRKVLPAGPVTMCITPGGTDAQHGCITVNLWQRQTSAIQITNPTNGDTLFSGNSVDFTWTGGKAGESVYISRWLNYGSNSLALCSGRNDANGNGACRWTINAPVGQHTIWARAASSQKDYDAKVDVTVSDKTPNSDLTLKNSYFTANVWDSTIQRKQVAGFKVTALGLPQNLIRVYLDFSGKIWENFAVLDVYDATMGASIFSKSIIAYDFEQVGSNWRIKLDPLRLQVPLEVNNPHELQVFLTTRDAGLFTTNYQVFVNMYAARSMGNNGLAYYAPERDAEVSNFFRVAPAAPRYFACTGLSCQVVKNPLTGKEVQSETECQIATNFAKTCYLNDSTCKNTCSGNCLKDRFAYKTSGDVCCSTDGYAEIDSSVLKPDGSCTPGNPDVKVCSKCGDGFCGGMENKCNCPADCGPLCSKQNANADDPTLCCPGLNFLTNKFRLGQNGTCVNSGFTNGICVNTKCGDSKCEGYEDKCNCPADCKDVVGCKQANQNSDFPALCCSGLGWLSNQYRLARDGSCIDSGFTNGICVTTKCGDNKCEGTEDKCNCPLDCTTSGTAIPGTCITDGKVIYPDGSVCCSGLTKISGKNLGADGQSCVEVYSAGIGFCSKCGDGKCENPENKCNCAQDCACGNGVCDNSENYQTCPTDCKEPTAQKYCYKGMYIYFSDYPNPKANNAKYWLSNWDLGNNIKGFLGNDAAAKAAAEMYVASLCDGNNSKSYNCSECERLDLVPEVVEKICFNQQGYYYRANKPSKETGTQFWVKIVLGSETNTLKYEKEGDVIAFMRSFKPSKDARYAEPCTGKEELFDFNYCDKSSPAKCQQEDKTTLTQCETKYGKGNCFKADPTCAGKCAKMEAFCRKCVHGMCAYYNPFGNDQTVNNAKWYIQDYVKGREVQPVGSDLEVDVVGRIENLWQGPQKESYDFAQCNTSDQMVDCYKNIVIWFAPAGNPKISGMKYYAKIMEDGNREFYIGGGYSADQNANIATIRSVLDSYVANTPNYTKQCFTDAKPGITRPPSIPDLSSAGKLYYYYDKKLNTCTQTDSTFATPNLCVANLKKMPLVLVAFPNCYESEDACWSAGRLYWYEKLVNGKWEFVLTSSRYKTEADCVAALKKFFTKNQAKYKCYLDKPGAEYLVVRKADTNNWIKKTGQTTAEGSIGLLLTAANGDVHLPVYNPNANDGIVMSGSIVGNNSLFDVGYSYICDATKSGDGTYYIIPKGRGSLCIISGKLTAQQKGKYYFAIKEINFEAVTTGATTKYNSQLVPIFSTFKTESVDLDSTGGSAPVCGDGNCEDSESKISCPQDCDKTPATCGNGNCDNGETAKNCPQDCNICLKAGPLVLSACGDGRCKASDGETISSCALDCNLGKDVINLATPNKNYTTLLKVRGINSNNTLSRNMLWVPYSFSSIATNKCNTVKVRFQFMPYDYSTGKDKQNILNTIGDVSFQFKNGASLNRAIGAKFEKQSDGSLKSDGINYFGITTYEFLINTPDPNINDYGVIKISKKEKTSWTDSSGATYTIDPYEIVFPINAYPMDCSCQAIARCGDGNCDNGETIDNCTVDCGVPILNISNAVVPKNVAADDPYYKGEWQYCYPDGKTLSPDCKKMFYCDLRNACVGRACNVTETSRYYYKLTSCQDGLTYQAALKGKTTGYCYNTRQEAESACQRYYFCAAGNGTATNVLLTKKAYTDVYDCTRTFKTDESTSGPIGQCYENEQEAKDHCSRWYYCPADPAKKGCSPTNVYADEAACVAAVIKNVPKALPKCYSNQDTCNSACQSNTLWTAYDDGKGTITCDQVKEKDRNGAIKQFYGKIEDAISECRQWLDTNNRKDTNRDCYKSFSDCDVAVSGTGRMRVCRRAGDEKCIALPSQYENTQTGCQKFLDDNKGLVGVTRCYDALYSADCDKACKDAGATAFKGAFYVKPDTTNNLNGGCLAISTFENNKTACDSELNKAWGTQTYSQCFNDVNDCNVKPKAGITTLPTNPVGAKYYYYSKKTDTCVQTYNYYPNISTCLAQLNKMPSDAIAKCFIDKKSCDAGGQRMWFFKRAGLNGEYAQTTERYTDIASCVSNLRIYYPSNQAYYQCYWSRAQLSADDKLDKFRLPFYTKIGGKCSYAGKYATQKGCEYALSAQCSLDPTCSVK